MLHIVTLNSEYPHSDELCWTPLLLQAGQADESCVYLVLDGVGPEDPSQEVVVVHPHGHSSVLGVDQCAQVVSMEVSYE